MRIGALFSPVTVLILVSCDGETPVDIFDIQGVVTGTVRTTAGASVPGAVVKGSAAYPLVSSTMSISDSTQTDPSGEYTLHFVTLNLADADAAVALQVRPPDTSGLLAADTAGFTVRIARSPDTSRVDVTLSEYQPESEHLVGEFSGSGGASFKEYHLFLAVNEVADSVRGLWSLSFATTCATHDGQFSGTLEGSELRLRLSPDEPQEPTLDVTAWIVPGDSLLAGNISLVQLGTDQLCFTIFDPFTLRFGDVSGLPVGR